MILVWMLFGLIIISNLMTYLVYKSLTGHFERAIIKFENAFTSVWFKDKHHGDEHERLKNDYFEIKQRLNEFELRFGEKKVKRDSLQGLYKKVFDLSNEIDFLWQKGSKRTTLETKNMVKKIDEAVPIAEKLLKNDKFLMCGTHINSPRSKQDFLDSFLLYADTYKKKVVKKGAKVGRPRKQDTSK